jgi:hypothetical protein
MEDIEIRNELINKLIKAPTAGDEGMRELVITQGYVMLRILDIVGSIEKILYDECRRRG